jgi:hypothetical protein
MLSRRPPMTAAAALTGHSGTEDGQQTLDRICDALGLPTGLPLHKMDQRIAESIMRGSLIDAVLKLKRRR